MIFKASQQFSCLLRPGALEISEELLQLDIIDAHHHLWDTNALHYTLFEDMPSMRRSFTEADYKGVAAANHVTGSVLVEAASAGADGWKETLWLLQQAKSSRLVRRIVAWAPLDKPELGSYLKRLRATGGDVVVAVRRSFEFESDDFPEQPTVIAGVKALHYYGYSVDLVLYERSLAAAIRLVQACPEVSFILDHAGKPRIRERLEHPWRERMAEMARLPNIVCKISGLSTEADHRNWKKENLKPYIDHVIACFGWDRVLFGSDWPVCDQARGFGDWLDALHWAISGASDGNRRKLFSENAKRVYRF
jgi:L-fuconolactonase